ncbi:MAG TPA: hypothetical protein VFA26_12445, partial [Gemmataceae bacterium]|nr:hypothetical protein [Gemmataceae bacterium]
AAAVPQPQASPTVRLQKEDDPFADANSRPARDARALLEKAEQEFNARRYDAAARLYEQAHQADPAAAAAGRDRWAYCRMFAVAQQLNQPPSGGPAYPELEREVRQAMSLAPRLEGFGKDLLKRIQERRGGPADDGTPVEVRHLERSADGWAVAETANFRIKHNQPRELAQKAAETAERTRAAMSRKWFGQADGPWSPKCDIYLHATAQDYSRATGVPAQSPGHSTIRSEGPRVLARRIDLHCDDPNLLTAVLPHETTHVVLAGKFDAPVPRWADEGMAVLTEPREKIDRHLRNLPQHRQERQMFYLRDLMNLNDYPHPSRVGAFYAQSVSVVQYLSDLKGPQTFTAFLRDGMRGGYETALRKHYDIKDFNDLEQRWRGRAFADGGARSAYVGKPR